MIEVGAGLVEALAVWNIRDVSASTDLCGNQPVCRVHGDGVEADVTSQHAVKY